MNTPPIIPPYLIPGDAIGLIAPARPIEEEALAIAIEKIEKAGFSVVHADNLHEYEHQFAGPDDRRAACINALIRDPKVKTLLSVRGGYGTVRIVDQLDWGFLRENPKWICGFSDITVLHNYASEMLNMATIHCAMPVTYANNTSEALASLFNALQGKDVPNYPARILREGTVTAPIVGGNLSVIYSQLGSGSQLDTSGKILFIEDLDEYLYHLDRMMWALRRAGMMEGIKGLMVGGFTAMRDNTIADGQSVDNPFGHTAEEIILSAIEGSDIPVAFDVPAGHLADNRAVVMGKEREWKFEGGSVRG